MTFADNVRRLRHERFLSQRELAEKAGVTRITIARIEAGDYIPYPRTIRQLAAALGVLPAELIPPAELEKKEAA